MQPLTEMIKSNWIKHIHKRRFKNNKKKQDLGNWNNLGTDESETRTPSRPFLSFFDYSNSVKLELDDILIGQKQNQNNLTLKFNFIYKQFFLG